MVININGECCRENKPVAAKSSPARPPRPLSLPKPAVEKRDSYDDTLNPFAEDEDLATPTPEETRLLPADSKTHMDSGDVVKFRIAAEDEDNDISIVEKHTAEHSEKTPTDVPPGPSQRIAPERPSRKEKKKE